MQPKLVPFFLLLLAFASQPAMAAPSESDSAATRPHVIAASPEQCSSCLTNKIKRCDEDAKACEMQCTNQFGGMSAATTDLANCRANCSTSTQACQKSARENCASDCR